LSGRDGHAIGDSIPGLSVIIEPQGTNVDMTYPQEPTGQYQGPHARQPGPVKKRVRVLTWVILAINALFLIWLVSETVYIRNTTCDHADLSCDPAKAVGGGVGTIMIITLWVAADVILGIIWLVTRKKKPTIG